jgi:hypothetical protein
MTLCEEPFFGLSSDGRKVIFRCDCEEGHDGPHMWTFGELRKKDGTFTGVYTEVI